MKKSIAQHVDVVQDLADREDELRELFRRVRTCLKRDGTVFLCGNGGSAADAQHIAAELVGRFERDRPGLSAVALTVDSSALTALSNDFGYARVFERQIDALSRSGDVLIGISTSGRSENVLRALRRASELGLITAGLTGENGGDMSGCTDVLLQVSSNRTARIQEAHILIGHLLCEHLDRHLKVESVD